MPRRRSKATAHAKVAVPISAKVQHIHLNPPNKVTRKQSLTTYRSLTALPRHEELIWTVDDFLTNAECEAWLAYLSSAPFSASLQRASAYTAFRDNGRLELCSADIAEALWTRLRPVLPEDLAGGEPIGCYDKIRLYRYVCGQRFGKHIDEAAQVSDSVLTGATVLVYLNDEGLEGGETVFYLGRRDEHVALSFRPKKGTLLIHG